MKDPIKNPNSVPESQKFYDVPLNDTASPEELYAKKLAKTINKHIQTMQSPSSTEKEKNAVWKECRETIKNPMGPAESVKTQTTKGPDPEDEVLNKYSKLMKNSQKPTASTKKEENSVDEKVTISIDTREIEKLSPYTLAMMYSYCM